MRRIWKRLFPDKPFSCSCGKSFRTDIEHGKHVWEHALAED